MPSAANAIEETLNTRENLPAARCASLVRIHEVFDLYPGRPMARIGMRKEASAHTWLPTSAPLNPAMISDANLQRGHCGF